MSELISADNLDLVIKKNSDIKDEILAQAIKLQTNPAIMKVGPASQLGMRFIISYLIRFRLIISLKRTIH